MVQRAPAGVTPSVTQESLFGREFHLHSRVLLSPTQAKGRRKSGLHAQSSLAGLGSVLNMCTQHFVLG